VERNHVWNGAAPMPCLSGMVYVAKIYGVTLKTLKDIDKLTKCIQLGTFASGSVNSGSLGSMAKDTPNLVDAMYIDESSIVQPFSIQEKPSSYVGTVGGSKPKPSKSKANFRSLFSENLCECVDFSIPRKVVETVSIPPIVDTLIVEKTNDGFQMVGKKKGKSKSTNGDQFGGHSFKQNVRYEPKATVNVPKKRATKKNLPLKASVPPTKEGNITVSNSNAALDDESKEEVENVYDESANLLNSMKAGQSSSTFIVAAG
nr:hypothetical protein [Tanacetum cinerariifolium]